MWKLVIISQAIFGLYLLNSYVNGVSNKKSLHQFEVFLKKFIICK